MFTGIIEAMGKVAAMTPKGGDVTLLIHSAALDFSDVQLGDSIGRSRLKFSGKCRLLPAS